MLTYQIRRRGLYTEPLGVQLTFPSDVELEFHLKPEAPFGRGRDSGYTAVVGQEAAVHFNTNTGRALVKPAVALAPVNLSITCADVEIRVRRP